MSASNVKCEPGFVKVSGFAKLFSVKMRSTLQQHPNPTGARDARFQSGEGISGILLRIRMLTRFPLGHKVQYPRDLSFVGPHESPNDDTGNILHDSVVNAVLCMALSFFTIGISDGNSGAAQ
jgi:hypothetical protein